MRDDEARDAASSSGLVLPGLTLGRNLLRGGRSPAQAIRRCPADGIDGDRYRSEKPVVLVAIV